MNKLQEIDTFRTDYISQIQDMKSELDDQSTQLAAQTNKLTSFNHRLVDSKKAVIAWTKSFQGHQYLLSHPFWRNVPLADSICRSLGGYLLELDDQREFDFIYNFIKEKQLQEWGVITGMTDGDHDGIWTSRESGKQMTYFNWATGEPNKHFNAERREDCVHLLKHLNYRMVAQFCQWERWERFICELET